jgi:hypothetical protein
MGCGRSKSDNFVHFLLLAALTHFAFAPLSQSDGDDPTEVTVRGRTVDAQTNAPLSGVRVTARSAGDVEETVSSSDGRFVFFSLRPGTYRMCTSNKFGYAASCKGTPKELFAGLGYFVTCVLSVTLD